MEQLLKKIDTTINSKQITCMVACIQTVDSTQHFFDWICRQQLGTFHLTLIHIAPELCVQSLPLSAMTASCTIARKEDQALELLAALEMLKKRIVNQFPQCTVDCRIATGDFSKTLIHVIEEQHADKLVLMKGQRQFPARKVRCSVEVIDR